jgi:hypothetical protein
MEWNEYTLATLVQARLDEARARHRLLVERRRPRVRARLGAVLMRIATWLLADTTAAPLRTRADTSRA